MKNVNIEKMAQKKYKKCILFVYKSGPYENFDWELKLMSCVIYDKCNWWEINKYLLEMKLWELNLCKCNWGYFWNFFSKLIFQIGLIRVCDTSWLTPRPVNPLNVGQEIILSLIRVRNCRLINFKKLLFKLIFVLFN